MSFLTKACDFCFKVKPRGYWNAIYLCFESKLNANCLFFALVGSVCKGRMLWISKIWKSLNLASRKYFPGAVCKNYLSGTLAKFHSLFTFGSTIFVVLRYAVRWQESGFLAFVFERKSSSWELLLTFLFCCFFVSVTRFIDIFLLLFKRKCWCCPRILSLVCTCFIVSNVDKCGFSQFVKLWVSWKSLTSWCFFEWFKSFFCLSFSFWEGTPLMY